MLSNWLTLPCRVLPGGSPPPSPVRVLAGQWPLRLLEAPVPVSSPSSKKRRSARASAAAAAVQPRLCVVVLLPVAVKRTGRSAIPTGTIPEVRPPTATRQPLTNHPRLAPPLSLPPPLSLGFSLSSFLPLFFPSQIPVVRTAAKHAEADSGSLGLAHWQAPSCCRQDSWCCYPGLFGFCPAPSGGRAHDW